uniref:U6 snRNA-associated Sm-like protein LSm2 n=1 Tax=Brugia malayi TaxID=6279 RepID=A0A1I9GBX6_BRUMA|nr:BMA-GUT-2 [Brugia malayi]
MLIIKDFEELNSRNNHRGKNCHIWRAYSFKVSFLVWYALELLVEMLFYSFFKSLVGKDVVVELKNDLSICGTLHSVDQYLNMKLTDISVTDSERYPHMLSVKNCFIRGSVVRYVQLPADQVDTQLLQDASRKEVMQAKRTATA